MIHKQKNVCGWQVVLLRPTQQIEPLASTLRQMGAEPLSLPTITITSIVLSEKQLAEAVHAIQQADWIIVSSQNAVHCASPTILQALSVTTGHIVTMGNATTRALIEKGVSVFFTPLPGTDSEGLLTEPFLQSHAVAHKRIVLLAGEGGRTVLAETFAKRQASVSWVKVYRQEKSALALAPILTEWSHSQKPFCFMATSENSLQHLLESVPAAQLPWLQKQVFIVVSHRIAQAAKKWEIQHIFVAKGADQEQLCATLLHVSEFCHTMT